MALVHQGDEKLFHGEAVAIDMAFSSVLAHVRGHLESETLDPADDALAPVYHERRLAADRRGDLRARQVLAGPEDPAAGAHGARLYNDVTQEEMDAALALWKEMCA